MVRHVEGAGPAAGDPAPTGSSDANDSLWVVLANQLAFGILLVDWKRHVRFASNTALAQLGTAGGLRVAHGVVEGATARDTRALQDAVDAACRGKRTYLRPGFGEQAPDMVVIPISGKPDAGAGIILGQARDGVPGCLHEYAQANKVTPAEERLLVALTSSATVKEAATRMGVQVSTARAQVQSLFLRTGWSSLRELTVRLWCLPAVAGPEASATIPPANAGAGHQ
jgi:hypothetical protein